MIRIFLCGAVLLVGAASHASPPAANAVPTGGQVAAGSAKITQSGNTVTVNQGSQRAVINWQSFNVGKDAKVNFVQPSADSATLNRVNSTTKTMIDGAVNSNGQVVFVNPNGVVFGKGAEVNTGGIIATTMNISDKDFMDGGGRQSYSGGANGKVVNKGKITVNSLDGYIALMAPEVKNEGVLVATMSGNNAIALVAGEKVTLTFSGAQLMNVNVDASSINALIKNKRLIQTDGGQIIIAANAASDLRASVINNTGTISATGLDKSGGRVVLTAGTITQAGTIEANGEGVASNGGTIIMQGEKITLAAGSQTNARGTANGGLINVGTTKVTFTQNADGTRSNVQAENLAKTVTVEQGATVDASSTVKGNGGDINIWSSEKTIVAGTFKAHGGYLGGNGGFVETSSSGILEIRQSTVVDVTAKSGKAGMWLLDPEDMVIDASTASALSTALATANVTIEVKGNLTVAADAQLAPVNGSATILTLNASGTVTNNGVIATSDSGSLVINAANVALSAGSSTTSNQISATAQTVMVSGTLNTTGGSSGSINLTGGAILLVGRVGSNGSSNPAGSNTTSAANTTTRTKEEELAAQAPAIPTAGSTTNTNTTTTYTGTTSTAATTAATPSVVTATATSAAASIAAAAVVANNNVAANAARVSAASTTTTTSGGVTVIAPAVNVIHLVAPTSVTLNLSIAQATTAAQTGTTTVINVATAATASTASSSLASLTFAAQPTTSTTTTTANTAPSSTAATSGGTITMVASDSISVSSTATITANASPNVTIAATSTTPSSTTLIAGSGGQINITAPQISTQTGALLQANGNNGPGGNFNLQATQLAIAGSVQANGNTGGVIASQSESSNIASGALIQANGNNGPGGAIALQTSNDQIINNATVQANGTGNGGNIKIASSSGGLNLQSALIQTNGANGRGGSIETQANSGSILTSSAIQTIGATQGGKITLTANTITLQNNSTLIATGNTGGGTVLVGGDWQGSNDVYQAQKVTMEAGAIIDVSALVRGNGGKVVLWSDVNNTHSMTSVSGTLIAEGGVEIGNGGSIETSGYLLQVNNIRGSVRANNGAKGMWLLDPYDVSVTSGGTTSTTSTTTISVTTIASLLQTGDVTIATSGSGSISIDASLDVSLTNAATLALWAHDDININAPITATGNALSLIFNTNYGGGNNSHVKVYRAITTNGGSVIIGGGVSGTALGYVVSNDSGAAVHVGYSPSITSASSATSSNVGMLLTGGGNVVLRGRSNGSNTSGILIDGPIWVGSGSISLDGYLATNTGAAVTLQIASRASYSIYPDTGVDALLYSTKASGSAVSITGTVDTSFANSVSYAVQSVWRSGSFQGISAYPVGYAIKTTGTGATVSIESVEASANVGGARLQIPVHVYVAGTYNLVTKSGFATAAVDGSTISSIGLSSYAGNVGFGNGVHGNPKTIIKTDMSAAPGSALVFDYYSTGDLSIYGYSLSDSMAGNVTVGSNPGNVYLPYAVNNLRITGAAVTLDNLSVNNNLQVIANTIQIGSTGVGKSRTVATSVSSGDIVSYQSWTQTNQAYLKAASWIKDLQSISWTITVDAPGINVTDLVLESPAINLFNGRFFNSYVNPNNGWHGHNLGAVAVANAGTVKISNSSSLTIGTVSTVAIDPSISSTLTSTVSGITASSYILVETKIGNLTIDAPVSSSGTGGTSRIGIVSTTSGTGPYTASTALATSGNGYTDYPIVLNAGANESAAFSTSNIKITSNGSIVAQDAILFSGGVGFGDTVIGNIAIPQGNFRYGSQETELTTGRKLLDRTAFSSGINLVFRESPTVTVSANSTNVTAVYGESIIAQWSVSGLLNGDTVTGALTESNGVTTGAGWSPINLPGGISETNTSHINNVTFTSGSGLVRAQSDGSLLGRTASSTFWSTLICTDCKTTYDLSTARIVKAGTYTISPMINAGTKTDLGYTVAIESKSLTVTPRPLSLSYSTADKVYNGSDLAVTTAAINPASSGTGRVQNSGGYTAFSDVVALGSITSSFASMGVGNSGADVYMIGQTVTAKNVTVSLGALSGADASNYAVTAGSTSSAKITPKALTASITPVAKDWDNTTTASITGGVSFSGLVSGQSITYSGGSAATFDTAQVGTGKTVTMQLDGAFSAGANTTLSNYALPTSATSTSGIINGLNPQVQYQTVFDSVSQTSIYLSLANHVSKMVVTGCPSGLTCTLLDNSTSFSQSISASSYTFNFSKIAVSANNLTNVITTTIPRLYVWIGGVYHPEYVVPTVNIPVIVTPKAVTATLDSSNVPIAAATSVYSGGTSFTNNGVALATSISTSQSGLTISGLTGNLSYNRSTAYPSDSQQATITGFTQTGGTYNYPTGTTSGDFAVSFVTRGTISSTVTPKTLTVTATKVYDNLASISGLTWTVGGFVAADSANTISIQSLTTTSTIPTTVGNNTLNGVTLVYTRPNCNPTPCSTYNNYRWPGGTAIYNPYGPDPITQVNVNGITLTITPRPLTVTPISATKVYGESDPTFSFTSGSLASGDTSSIFSGALSRASGETVSGGPYSFAAGTLSAGSNYALTIAPGSALTITPRVVTLSASKTYDGTAALSGSQVSIGNLVGSETLTYSGAAANDAHVGTANKFIQSITLGDGTNGGLVSNYQLPNLNAANAGVTIAAATLTPSLSNTGVTKVYDGTTSSNITPTYTFSGLVSGDTSASLTNTSQAYDTPNVSTASKVTVFGLSINSITGTIGSLSSDYVLNATSKDVAASITPRTLTPSLSNTGVTKVYDGTTSSSITPTYTFSGLVSGDTSASLTNTSQAYDTSNVSTASKVTVFGLSINSITGTIGSLSSDYVLNATSKDVAASITPRVVTLSASKTYDGTAALSGSQVSIGNLVGSETLTYSGAAANDAHVGTANKFIQTITLGDGTNGGLVSNYQLPNLNAANAGVTIAAATLTPSLSNTGVTKVYDGTTNSSITPTYTFSGLVSGDTSASLTNTSQAYDTSNVSTASKVTVFGLSINSITGTIGSLSSDYVLSATSKDVAASITPRTLTPSLSNTGVTKVYDGTTSSNITPTYTFSGLVSGDTSASLTNTSQAYDTSNVSTASKVTVFGLSINSITGTIGSLSSDYVLSATSKDVAASITPRTLTPSLSNTGVTKVYDGTTSSNITPTYTFSGLVSGDTSASLTNTSQAYDTSNVSTASKVTVFGLSINSITGTIGSLSSDYVLSATSKDVAASITPRTLTPSLSNTGVTKVYDGTTSSNITPTYTFSGLVSGDTSASLTNTSQAYDTSNVSTASKVTVFGLSINSITGTIGSLSSDYVLNATSKDVAASITPRVVTLSASKTYDGTAALSGSQVSIGNLVGSETLTYSGAAANDAHVGTANKFIQTITLGDGTNGGLVSNYQLPTLNAANAGVTIAAATLTPSLSNTGVTKVYDGTTSSSITPTYTFSGLVSGDTSASLTNTSQAYDTSNVSTASKVTVFGLSINSITGTIGSLSSDYVLNATSKDVAASITPRVVTLSASKTYDGTAALSGSQVSIGNLVGSETLTYSGAAANDAHVGTANKFIQTITLGDGTNGGLVSNYQLPNLNAANAGVTIAAATLTPSLSNTGVTKVYDGTTNSSITPTYTFSGLVSGDTSASLTNTSQAYDTSNVSTASKVTVFGLSINSITGTIGSLSSDYVLSATSKDVAASITPRTLTPSLSNTGVTKVYDGTTSSNITPTYTFSGLVSGDTSASLTNTSQAYDTSNVSTASKVTVFGLSINSITGTIGSLSSDYVLSATSKDVAASITPRVVTLSASKTYDGTAALSGSQVSIGNLVGSETLTYSGAAANDALVGTANKFIQTITLGDGTNGGLVSNYQLPNLSAANAAVTIRERVNTVAVTDALFLGISYVPANQGIFAVTTFTTQPTPQVTGATGTASSSSNLSVPITAETIFGSTINYAASGYGSGRDSASSNMVASSSNVGLVSSDILTPVRQKFADQTTVARASSFADLNSSATDRTSNEGTAVARPQTTNTNTVDTPARDVLAGGFKENELKVSTIKGVDNQSQGAVKVDVPETLSKGFVFEMPQEFKDLRADTGVTATATQQDGSALPSWLSFDGESLKFSASAVPAGSLPFTATVRIGDKTVVVEVTESSLGQ